VHQPESADEAYGLRDGVGIGTGGVGRAEALAATVGVGIGTGGVGRADAVGVGGGTPGVRPADGEVLAEPGEANAPAVGGALLGVPDWLGVGCAELDCRAAIAGGWAGPCGTSGKGSSASADRPLSTATARASATTERTRAPAPTRADLARAARPILGASSSSALRRRTEARGARVGSPKAYPAADP